MSNAPDVLRLQDLINSFVSILKDTLKDMFTGFGDIGGQLIIILVLTTALVITAGGILTVYFMIMRALEPH